MPLAVALGVDNLECQVNNPAPDVIEMWEELKNIGHDSPQLLKEDLVYVSVRDTEKPEDDFMARNQIKNYTVDEVRAKGMQQVSEEIKERMTSCDIVYVSFDVDSMDSILVSKGTGTPVEHGLTPEEANYFVCEFASWDKTCCVEMVEINPCLDNKINKMAEVAYDILSQCAVTIEKRF
jgi:arginase